MKRTKNLIIILISIFYGTISAHALSARLTTNVTTIENGSSVTATLTLRDVAAWNVEINSGGSTSGCSKSFADATSDGKNATKTFSVTCKATSVGIINFSISGDITSSNGTNTKISGNKNVTVKKPREKSSNNKLSKLEIKDFELTPKFKADVNSYEISVPSTTETIIINATKTDKYASLEGTGEKEVTAGVNNFDVIVTSETGVSNIYKLIVNVEDLDPIYVTVNDEKYTVVKEEKNLVKPELFESTTIDIGEFEIPAFKSGVVNFVLVGLKNKSGEIKLFIYEDGKYRQFKELLSSRLNLLLKDIQTPIDNLNKMTIDINGESIIAYKSDFITVVRAIDLATGKENLYTYNDKEKTLQLFNEKEFQKLLSEDSDIYTIVYILSAALIVLLLISILLYKKTKSII